MSMMTQDEMPSKDKYGRTPLSLYSNEELLQELDLRSNVYSIDIPLGHNEVIEGPVIGAYIYKE